MRRLLILSLAALALSWAAPPSDASPPRRAVAPRQAVVRRLPHNGQRQIRRPVRRRPGVVRRFFRRVL